jgi:hypothetical protein
MFINADDLGVLSVPSEAPGGVERSLARRIFVLDLPCVPRVRERAGRVAVTLSGCPWGVQTRSASKPGDLQRDRICAPTRPPKCIRWRFESIVFTWTRGR